MFGCDVLCRASQVGSFVPTPHRGSGEGLPPQAVARPRNDPNDSAMASCVDIHPEQAIKLKSEELLVASGAGGDSRRARCCGAISLGPP